MIKSVSKTPYEIRLELLQLAQTILNERHSATAASEAKAAINENSGRTFKTTSPTTEEIIAEAEKLNNFVSRGSQQ